MGVDSQVFLHWGFIGCGNIANDFVNALKGMPSETARLSACAARSLGTAQTFANTHGFDRAYGSYEEVCADPEVDVVYIATIHLMHFEHITLALNHGKHVLAEKPLTMNVKQTVSVVELAKTKQLFLMEGMQECGWTRCFPFLKYVRQLIDEGQIGSEALVYEAESVTKAIRCGKLHCDEYTPEESLAIAKTMDEIRSPSE